MKKLLMQILRSRWGNRMLENSELYCSSTNHERESNIELYRIILMLSIIAHHYIMHSGLLSIMCKNPISIKSIFLFIIGAWGKIGINCFVLITGYYMCKSKISLKKFMKLLLEVQFYEILFYFILYLY